LRDFSLERRESRRFTIMPRVTITVPNSIPQPYRFELDRRQVNIGRGSENDIVVECASVSGRHAEMVRVEGGYEVRDLGSTNGIKLGGKREEVIAMKSDMTIHLGDVAFHFLLSDEEIAALANERTGEESPVIRENPLPELPKLDLPEVGAGPVEDPAGSSGEPSTRVAGGCGALWIVLLFIVFAAVAFVVGLAIRHQKETGESLFSSLKFGSRVEEKQLAAPAPPPAEEEVPALDDEPAEE
jgi:hypothetical protein